MGDKNNGASIRFSLKNQFWTKKPVSHEIYSVLEWLSYNSIEVSRQIQNVHMKMLAFRIARTWSNIQMFTCWLPFSVNKHLFQRDNNETLSIAMIFVGTLRTLDYVRVKDLRIGYKKLSLSY